MADADLYNLEFLSLLAKITQEIDNHLGINDKTTAEFVINLHEESNKNIDTFKAQLQEARFPDSLVENIDRLILGMHPKYKKKVKSTKASEEDDGISELERKRRMFPGLAVKDKEVPPVVPDDVFLKELGDLVAGKTSNSRPYDEEPPLKRQRREGSYSPRRRSRSPRRRDGFDYRNGAGKQSFDERPVLYKIYNGKVTGIKEFGAFVTLERVAGRVEGRSHVPGFQLRLTSHDF